MAAPWRRRTVRAGKPTVAFPSRAANSLAACTAPRSASFRGAPHAAARDAEVVRPLSKLPNSSIGLYDSSFERDACGVGFVAELSGDYKRETVSYIDSFKVQRGDATCIVATLF